MCRTILTHEKTNQTRISWFSDCWLIFFFFFIIFTVYHMKETGWIKVSQTDVTELHYKYKEEMKWTNIHGIVVQNKEPEVCFWKTFSHELLPCSTVCYVFFLACSVCYVWSIFISMCNMKYIYVLKNKTKNFNIFYLFIFFFTFSHLYKYPIH